MLIDVTLIGPDQVRSIITISGDTTVRDIATCNYHLFWRNLKKNGISVPFTAKVLDGDIVSVHSDFRS